MTTYYVRIRARIEPTFSGSSSVRFVFFSKSRFGFGSTEFSKSRFEFGSDRFEPNRTETVRLVRFRALVESPVKVEKDVSLKKRHTLQVFRIFQSESSINR